MSCRFPRHRSSSPTDSYSTFDKLVKAFSTMFHRRRKKMSMEDIYECIRQNPPTQYSGRRAIISAMLLHRDLRANEDNCQHTLVHKAAKVAFKFYVTDWNIVKEIVLESFMCKEPLKNLVTEACMKSESHYRESYGDLKDWKQCCIDMLKYLMDHTCSAHLHVIYRGVAMKPLDVPCDSCNLTPIMSSLLANRDDLVRTFLQYGAAVSQHPLGALSPFDWIGDKAPTHLSESVSVLGLVRRPNAKHWPLPSLKHLTRLAIRDALSENYELPLGIGDLPLPKELRNYIDLVE